MPHFTITNDMASDSQVIILDTMSSGLARTTVSLALCYTVKADITQLCSAFGKVLQSYEALAGCIVKTEVGLVIRCNNAGVPLSHDTTRVGNTPGFGRPIPEDLFDIATSCFPTKEQPVGDVVLRICVTDFDDGQVIRLSLNHGITDATGMGCFLKL